MNEKEKRSKKLTLVQKRSWFVEDSRIKKSSELYRKGKELVEEGERLLRESRKLRGSVILQKIEELKKRHREENEKANRLFIEGTSKIEEGKLLWKGCAELLEEEDIKEILGEEK